VKVHFFGSTNFQQQIPQTLFVVGWQNLAWLGVWPIDTHFPNLMNVSLLFYPDISHIFCQSVTKFGSVRVLVCTYLKGLWWTLVHFSGGTNFRQRICHTLLVRGWRNSAWLGVWPIDTYFPNFVNFGLEVLWYHVATCVSPWLMHMFSFFFQSIFPTSVTQHSWNFSMWLDLALAHQEALLCGFP